MHRQLATVLLLTATSWADPDTHYLDLPIGERAAGMGGAFTALADEGTGLHYNPAGPALFPRDTLNLTMSAYRYRKTSAKGIERYCDEEADFSESQFFTFPGAFGLVKGFGRSLRQAVGLTVLVPDNLLSRKVQTVQGIDCPDSPTLEIVSSRSQAERTLWFDLSYSIRPARWLSIGAGPVINLRTIHFDQTLAVSNNIGSVSSYVQLDGYVWNIGAQLGVLALVGEHGRIGFSARTPTVEFAQGARLAQSSLTGDPTVDFIGVVEGDDDIDLRYPLPWKFALGAAWMQPGRFTLSADVTFHMALDAYVPISITGVTDSVGDAGRNFRDPVWNFAVGGEWYATPSIDLLAGIFTNRTSYPDIRVNQGAQDNRILYPHIDYYGLSLGVATLAPHATISLVFQTMVGFGEIAGSSADSLAGFQTPQGRIVDITDVVLTAMLGGSFDL